VKTVSSAGFEPRKTPVQQRSTVTVEADCSHINSTGTSECDFVPKPILLTKYSASAAL
jgi:hypothetical protein